MSAVPELPVELSDALALSEEAQRNWDDAPLVLRKLYIEHVAASRKRHVREQRAADTALAAKLGTLTEHARGRTPSWWDVVAALPLPIWPSR